MQEALGTTRVVDAALLEKSAKEPGARQLLFQEEGTLRFRV
jgi:hypothetical protein